METLQYLRDKIKSFIKPNSEAGVDQISASDPKPGLSQQPDWQKSLSPNYPSTKHSDEPMETEYVVLPYHHSWSRDSSPRSLRATPSKYIKPPACTSMWYKLGHPCFEDKLQELNTDLQKSVSPLNPLGKVPLPVAKEFEHQAKQNLCTLNFSVAFTKTASECNLTMEKCQDSIKATVKSSKSQIQKGANPEKAARHGYEKTCDYLDILNKRILIQQRALACQTEALAHILQRELYTMGNSILIRREAEMTLIQPHLPDSRRQKLRGCPFWSPPLFWSQLVKGEEEILLKKGTP